MSIQIYAISVFSRRAIGCRTGAHLLFLFALLAHGKLVCDALDVDSEQFAEVQFYVSAHVIFQITIVISLVQSQSG